MGVIRAIGRPLVWLLAFAGGAWLAYVLIVGQGETLARGAAVGIAAALLVGVVLDVALARIAARGTAEAVEADDPVVSRLEGLASDAGRDPTLPPGAEDEEDEALARHLAAADGPEPAEPAAADAPETEVEILDDGAPEPAEELELPVIPAAEATAGADSPEPRDPGFEAELDRALNADLDELIEESPYADEPEDQGAEPASGTTEAAPAEPLVLGEEQRAPAEVVVLRTRRGQGGAPAGQPEAEPAAPQGAEAPTPAEAAPAATGEAPAEAEVEIVEEPDPDGLTQIEGIDDDTAVDLYALGIESIHDLARVGPGMIQKIAEEVPGAKSAFNVRQWKRRAKQILNERAGAEGAG
ncbi:MAG: hypothetical protein D6832_00745 [Alphaproteobacteria bacterium]|nr:MAG: hypothetical protein D6832_00745 [Alphaproteobacteria bacterium]